MPKSTGLEHKIIQKKKPTPLSIRPIRKELSTDNMRTYGIQQKYFNLSLDDFNTYGKPALVDMVNFVKKYIDEIAQNRRDGCGILFYGPNGVGKSFMSNIIAKEAYRHRYTAKRCTLLEYSEESRRKWKLSGNDLDEWEEYFNRYWKYADFLMLEEIGKEYDSDGGKVELEALLRFREENNLPTIICTNLNPDSLKSHYGNSIYSLLTGMCTFFGLSKVSLEDQRKNQRKLLQENREKENAGR